MGLSSGDAEGTLDSLFGRAASRVCAASEPWPGLEYLVRREGLPLPARAPTAGEDAASASDDALRAVRAAERAADAAGVLSRNDTIDDVATRSLRFVLLPYLASLARASWQGQAADRLDALEDARREAEAFFRRVDALGLLPATDRDRVLGDTPDLVETPMQKRDALIARFRAEKAAARTLETLLARRFSNAESSATAANGGLDAGNDVDEEHERDAMLTIIESAVRRSIDSLSGIDRELEVLRYAVSAEARGVDPAEEAARQRPTGPPPGPRGMPSTFRIVDKREEIRKGVFRPDHSLPTYTIEEWGEIEMKHAAEVAKQKQEREIVRARAKADEDSDGDAATDRATYEARRWDNWKDEHNKGSGNSMR